MPPRKFQKLNSNRFSITRPLKIWNCIQNVIFVLPNNTNLPTVEAFQGDIDFCKHVRLLSIFLDY